MLKITLFMNAKSAFGVLFPIIMVISAMIIHEPVAAQSCEYWVAPAPAGNDTNPGSNSRPWATLAHAADAVPDNHCTVWFKVGVFVGGNRLNRRFNTPTLFKSIVPYQAIFHNSGPVVQISGGKNIVIEGFVFRHSGPGASPLVFVIDRSGDDWAENITLFNNIFHDSYNNDLLKVHNGSRFIIIKGNVFYNQGSSDQHLDINSVTDVFIQDNIFFNDFAGSGRSNPGDTKAFITIKDSNEGADGLTGSERVIVQQNIFLNWQGGNEPFLQVGNDGKSYHEAKDIRFENNLMIGNSQIEANAVLAISGAKDVYFVNNTVVGDLPSYAYALSIDRKGSNPVNQGVYLYNNIWSDPTGSMGARTSSDSSKFSKGDLANITDLVLDSNLYWNGGSAIPSGELVSPLIDDFHRVIGNPLLNINQENMILPRWKGSKFLSGSTTIRQEFVRLVFQYGMIPISSPAFGMANPVYSSNLDILGRSRPQEPSLGAFEIQEWRYKYLPLIRMMRFFSITDGFKY